MLHLRATMTASGLTVLACGAVSAEIFPSRHIRVVTSQRGGLNDLAARVIAEPLSRIPGRQVIVDNRGASR